MASERRTNTTSLPTVSGGAPKTCRVWVSPNSDFSAIFLNGATGRHSLVSLITAHETRRNAVRIPTNRRLGTDDARIKLQRFCPGPSIIRVDPSPIPAVPRCA